MTENKLINSLMIVLVISIIVVAYEYINQTFHGYYSFYVTDVEVGKYASYQECLADEEAFHHYNLNDDSFEYGSGNCSWRK